MSFENEVTKTYDSINNYTLNIQQDDAKINYTLTGYTTVQTISDEAFLESDTTFVNLDNLSAIVDVTQPNPRKPFNCNFSFNINFSVKIRLPKITPEAPDFSLIYKIDTFSREVSNINDDLIKAIRSLNCCDIEHTYNKTLVPFFRWFADSRDSKDCGDGTDNCGPMFGGDTFPEILLNIAKPLIQIYVIVRPFACLIRPLPGNPWFPWDFDILKYFRFILDYFDMYNDYVISGKIMDPLIDIVSDIRKKLDNCVFGESDGIKSLSENTYQNLLKKNYFISLINKNIQIYQSRIDKLKQKKLEVNKKISTIKSIPIFFTDDSTITNNYDEIRNYLSVMQNNPYKTFILQEFFNIIEIKNSEPLTEYDKLKIIEENMTEEDVKKYIASLLGLQNIDDLSKWKVITEYGSSNENVFVSSFLFAYLKSKFQELLNLYEEINQIDDSIKILTDIIDQYQKMKKETIDASTNESPPGALSDAYHKVNLKNVAGNYSANLCNCIIHTLLPDAKIPKLVFLQDYSLKELSKIENHLDTEIKKSDISSNPCATNIKDNSDSLLFYCTDFIEKLNQGFNDDIIRILNEYNNLNIDQITDLSKNFITIYNNLISNIDNINIDSFNLDYLTQVKKNSSIDYLKIVQAYELDSETFDIPYSGGTVTVQVPSLSFLSQVSLGLFNLESLDVYQSYKLKLIYTATSRACDSIISKIAMTIDSVAAIDYQNFKDTVSKVNAILNAINLKIKANMINFSEIEKIHDTEIFNNYLDFIRNYINNYHFYDPEKDPSDLSIQYIKSYAPNFINIELSAAASEIQTLFSEYLDKREKLVKDNFVYFIQYNIFKNKIKKVIDNINQNEMNFIHTVVIQADIDITPCSCDIFCQVLQYIIDKLLSIVSLLLQMLINMILDWIMKSFIGKIIKLIIAKIKCILEFTKIDDYLDSLDDLKDSIEKALKDRIQLYKDPLICMATNNTTNDLLNNLNNNANTNTLLPNSTTNTNTDNENPDNTIILPQDPIVNVGDSLPDNNIGNNTVDINSNGETTEILLNPDSNLYQPPLIPDSVAQALPATLITTDSIEVGIPNEHGFPLLTFACECDDSECKDCKDKTKAENTIKFFNQV